MELLTQIIGQFFKWMKYLAIFFTIDQIIRLLDKSLTQVDGVSNFQAIQYGTAYFLNNFVFKALPYESFVRLANTFYFVFSFSILLLIIGHSSSSNANAEKGNN